ncbi:uncharacterized protein N7515_000421 [Penicillium bovifimosum]|uniref:Uncharacterized protein n=1 Tax=Penicillium bovifimosum TaxID=126998 RepID=A0A9W9LB23_9EURO|nr:uncharacterized protein N7515_000421 [Penicillium bovifimosum]KAJ5145857.1 hypothetical protein N7515_000421 [Penicillium bovifimosum]
MSNGELKTNDILCGSWEDYSSVDASELGTQWNAVVAMYNEHGFIACNMTPDRWREVDMATYLSGIYETHKASLFKDEKITTLLVSAMENPDNDKFQGTLYGITGRQPSVIVYERQRTLDQTKDRGGTFVLYYEPDNPGEKYKNLLCKTDSHISVRV